MLYSHKLSPIHKQYKQKSSRCSDILPFILLLLAITVLSAFGNLSALLAWIVLIVWALRNSARSIESLLGLVLLLFLNPTVFAVPTQIEVMRWLVTGAIIGRVGIEWIVKRHFYPPPNWIKANFVFVGTASTFSLIASPYPTFSIIKLALYLVVTTSIYTAVTMNPKHPWRDVLLGFGAYLVICSLPFVFTPYGYERNGLDFQGMLSHPQTFGVAVALPLVILIVEILESPKRTNLLKVLLLTVMGITMVISNTRTASFIVVLSVILYLILALFTKRDFFRKFFLVIFTISLALTLALLTYGTSNGQKFAQLFLSGNIVLGGDSERSLDISVQQLLNARGSYRQQSWSNFVRNPITGIGFGIPSVLGANSWYTKEYGQRDWMQFDLPANMRTEKGNLVTTSLEEVGLLSSLILFVVFILLIRQASKQQNAIPVILVMSAITINLSEMIFFSVTALGAIVHISLAVALNYRFGSNHNSPATQHSPKLAVKSQLL